MIPGKIYNITEKNQRKIHCYNTTGIRDYTEKLSFIEKNFMFLKEIVGNNFGMKAQYKILIDNKVMFLDLVDTEDYVIKEVKI